MAGIIVSFHLPRLNALAMYPFQMVRSGPRSGIFCAMENRYSATKKSPNSRTQRGEVGDQQVNAFCG